MRRAKRGGYWRGGCWVVLVVLCAASASLAQGATDKLPHIHVDLKARRVEVDCQSLNVDAPLEFLCVINGGNEHESVLRTAAKPSDIHLALLMLGLTPGAPARYSPADQAWTPPHGPPLSLTCSFELNGHAITVPAYQMMRGIKSQKPMAAMTWVFDGSRVMSDGVYAADVTGYVVSICNFDLTLIDVPGLVSNANETLEWECNPAYVPAKGTAVKLIIEPAREARTLPSDATMPSSRFNPGPGLSAVEGLAPPRPASRPSAPSNHPN